MSDEEPVTSSKPSQAPSWMMLGFLLGALFVWALPRHALPQIPLRPSAPAAASRRPERPAAAPQFTTVEVLFDQWGKYAIWDNDVTEIAVLDPATRRFSDCFEVLRSGGNCFFRSIPELTRPVLTHGEPPPECPVQFTETEQQRAHWLSESADESWRQLGKAIGGAPPSPKP